VRLKIYDVLGNEVATLVNEEKSAGSYEVEFQSAVGNKQLASGIYYYRLHAGNYVETKKMVFLK
jgi:5-hydroxyisourate hydrolase-like protein (transthyretin family)